MSVSKRERSLIREIQDKRRKHWKENKENTNAIEVKNLVVDFGETLALKKVNLSIKKGELVTLVGPSGCGKTTLLNTIAGLLTPTSGEIIFGSKNMTKSSPKDRKLGFVFQNYALYPHLSVYKNIAFPLMNDEKWKNEVKKKNRINEMKIKVVKLKAMGISEKEIKKMEELFFTFYDVERETNDYFEYLLEQKNKKIWNARIEYDFLKTKKKQDIKDVSRRILDKLRNKEKEIKECKKENDNGRNQKIKNEYKTLVSKSKKDYKEKIAYIKKEYKENRKLKLKELRKTKVLVKNNLEHNSRISEAKKNKSFAPSIAKKAYLFYVKELEDRVDIQNAKFSESDLLEIKNLESKILSIKKVVHQEVLSVSEVVGITKNLSKKPTKLSGGQQQRVAIARAIVKKPSVLLMDEPLSNLDAKLRISTREWIREIQRELGITTVFVTHDQEEAMAISDTVVCMSEGLIQQIGNPMELYDNPVNTFVAKFIGMPEMKLLETTINKKNEVLLSNKPMVKLPKSIKENVLIGGRAEFLKETTKNNGFKVKIKLLSLLGRETLATVVSEEFGQLQVFLKKKSNYKINDTLYLNINKKNIILFSKKTGMRI